MALDKGVDGRADLYALGCVAYYALTGKLVFEATSAVQMLARHVCDPPPPLAERDVQGVPAELGRVISACLEKQPENRPPTAAALAAQLTAIELEPWTEEQAARWWAAT